MQTVHVLYHSREWARLIEQGYITKETYRNPSDGAIIAIMLYHPLTIDGRYNR